MDEEMKNEGEAGLRKRKLSKYHGQRAHANPLSAQRFDWCPWSPALMNWSVLYPDLFPSPDAAASTSSSPSSSDSEKEVTMADVGCGYGGLTVALGVAFPDEIILGLELRDRVALYVQERIENLRKENDGKMYTNVAVERANCMKSLPFYFRKGQLKSIFFCFPDPHFKKKNHRRRIINVYLLAEYAYCLRSGGLLYCVSDVEELHIWMRDKCLAHPLFVQLTDAEVEGDVALNLAMNATEESMKVSRANGNKYYSVFRRI